MSPTHITTRPPLSLTVGAVVACGLVTLGAAITSRTVHRDSPMNGHANAEFVVTSGRDAGPGSLRDAILAADRLSSRCHIVIKAPRIVIESALPALINPHGVELEAAAGAGTIDADREPTGSAIEVKGTGSILTGIHVLHAHGYGILIDSSAVQLVSVTVQDSKVGIMLGAGAFGAIIRASLLEHDETGVMAEPGIRQVTLASDIFRLNTRAGLWFVGAAAGPRGASAAAPTDPLIRVLDTVFEKNATGVVLANEAGQLQKDHFIDNHAALTVLGGAARIDDSEISGSEADAVSVISGRSVVLDGNTLVDNKATALMVRDSDVSIETNTFARNGVGIVLIGGPGSFTPLVKGNRITDSRGDGIMLIGGTLRLEDNQLLENRGAALRPLDFVTGTTRLKADARSSGNVFHANGLDVAPTGIYRLKDGS
ncbi:MAG TPA: right-handed parallel beta-helix repeat-containing protein [Steroidobacteraceae bacterium]|nr:right-handed parallel beta-helix repeat-containing protein [Steroidobacteraceae bacterium]